MSISMKKCQPYVMHINSEVNESSRRSHNASTVSMLFNLHQYINDSLYLESYRTLQVVREVNERKANA